MPTPRAVVGRRGVAIVVVALLVGAGGASLAIAAPNTSRSLRTVALRASQVGPGYRGETTPQSFVSAGGTGFGCVHAPKGVAKGARNFARAYVKPGSPGVFNVLSEYRSADVLAEAMTALRHALEKCPSATEKIGAGQFVRIQLTRVTAPRLIPGSIGLREVIFGGSGTYKSNTLLGICQAARRIVSCVLGGSTNVAATRAVIVHAAQESARNLR